jgi:hypothetical protein
MPVWCLHVTDTSCTTLRERMGHNVSAGARDKRRLKFIVIENLCGLGNYTQASVQEIWKVGQKVSGLVLANLRDRRKAKGDPLKVEGDGGLGSYRDQSVWVLLWTKWHWVLSPRSSVCPCQHHSTVSVHTHLSPGGEQGARWGPQFRDIVSPQLTNSVAQEPEGSSPHSQQSATGPCPETDESNPHPPSQSP